MDSNTTTCTYDKFEGPEKLLEIWFGPLDDEIIDGPGEQGLRTVPREEWDAMLSLVNCQVLNVVSNEYFDAYLLSESSMFVWNGKIILKTCGTTTLLKAVPKLLELAKEVGLTEVENLFYSRNKFMYPEKQLVPHSSFSHEVEFLDGLFEDGSAYVLGRLNDEHWYLYMTEPQTPVLSRKKSEQLPPDNTFEILMGGLDQQAMAPFFKSSKLEDATKDSGIAALFPDATIDSFSFDPCGYSCNALMGSNYFTIHITPQDPCSFASFETNVVLEDYNELFRKVVSIFKPRQLSATLFTNQDIDSLSTSTAQFDLDGYAKTERTFYQFNLYSLLFVAQKEVIKERA